MQQIELNRLYKLKKCLVIDDYPDIRATIKRMMNKFGCEDVDTALNGEDAMNKCASKTYDIILADYNLGEKKSGQQVLEELRYRGLIKHASIYVMITAETTRDKVYSAIENQPDAYLAKPFTPPALQKRLDVLLVAREELKEINAAADKGNYDLAIKLCKERIYAADKYLVPCQKMLGQFYYESKRYDEGIELYRKVLAERSLTWALIGLGRILLAKGILDEPEKIFGGLAAENSPFLEVYDGLAEIHARRGDLHEAQSVLERAIEMAPETILRQKRLAEYSMMNDDLERAERAYRRVVKIGYNSVYEEPDNYFEFVHCINKISQNQSGSDRKRYEEATEVLARAQRRYKGDPDVIVRSKFAQAETCVANHKETMAKEALREAEESFAKIKSSHDFDPKVSLEYARALDMSGEKDRAKQILLELAEKCQNNPDVQKAIDSCLDEPVSKQGQGKIIEFNREGKKLFEDKDFKGAVDYFDKALRIYPNHVALNLNLAMALLKSINVYGKQPGYMKRLRTVMFKLRKVDSQNEYFNLYNNILQQVQKLQQGD